MLATPARTCRSSVISGKKNPAGALVAVRPLTTSFTSPAGTSDRVKRPVASVVVDSSGWPSTYSVTPASGSFQVSCAKSALLPVVLLTSSGVSGVLSAPGSTTMPVMEVPGTMLVDAVWNDCSSCVPVAAKPAVCNGVPSDARITAPSRCSVMVDDPGIPAENSSHAPVPFCNGAMAAGTTAPDGSVA